MKNGDYPIGGFMDDFVEDKKPENYEDEFTLSEAHLNDISQIGLDLDIPFDFDAPVAAAEFFLEKAVRELKAAHEDCNYWAKQVEERVASVEEAKQVAENNKRAWADIMKEKGKVNEE
jgi:hypothetical protein